MSDQTIRSSAARPAAIGVASAAAGVQAAVPTASADDKADAAIGAMVKVIVAMALIPAHVNWAFSATAIGTGVVAIGLAYGVTLTKDEAWHLVKQFVRAAGLWFVSMQVGTKILSALLASTGIGYLGAVAIDATVSAAFAYAIGESAKAYFKGVRNTAQLGHIMRNRFMAHKATVARARDQQPDVNAA